MLFFGRLFCTSVSHSAFLHFHHPHCTRAMHACNMTGEPSQGTSNELFCSCWNRHSYSSFQTPLKITWCDALLPLHPQASPKKWGTVPGNVRFISFPLCLPSKDQSIHFLFSLALCTGLPQITTVVPTEHGVGCTPSIWHVACCGLCSKLQGCTEGIRIYKDIGVGFSSLSFINSYHQTTAKYGCDNLISVSQICTKSQCKGRTWSKYQTAGLSRSHEFRMGWES